MSHLKVFRITDDGKSHDHDGKSQDLLDHCRAVGEVDEERIFDGQTNLDKAADRLLAMAELSEDGGETDEEMDLLLAAAELVEEDGQSDEEADPPDGDDDGSDEAAIALPDGEDGYGNVLCDDCEDPVADEFEQGMAAIVEPCCTPRSRGHEGYDPRLHHIVIKSADIQEIEGRHAPRRAKRAQ